MDELSNLAKRPAARILGRMVFVSLLWGLLYALALVPAVIWLEAGNEGTPAVQLYGEAAGLGTLLIATWLTAARLEDIPLSSIGFPKANAVRDGTIGCALGATLLAIAFVFLGAVGVISSGKTSPPPADGLAIMIGATVLNAALQEVWFRGNYQRMLGGGMSQPLAILLSNIIFLLVHWPAIGSNLLAAVNVLLAGALFGVAYAVAGNLWMPIGIHASWNVLLGPVLGLTVSGRDIHPAWQPVTVSGSEIMTGGRFGIEASIATTISLVLGIAALLLWEHVSGRGGSRPNRQPKAKAMTR